MGNGARPLRGGVAPGVFRHCVPRQKHHIAGKPVELMEGLMSVMTGPILDPFMGSGTIGIACLKRGLPYVGIEALTAEASHLPQMWGATFVRGCPSRFAV